MKENTKTSNKWTKEMVEIIIKNKDRLKIAQFMVLFIDQLITQTKQETATKLRRIIAGIPITKGLADGGKIRKKLTGLVNSLEEK